MDKDISAALRQWAACGLAFLATAWGAVAIAQETEEAPAANRVRVVFDRVGGFTVQQGEEAAITATLAGGSGGMWFSWQGNNGGTATGDGGETFMIDTSVPGEYWLRAVGGSDGTDGDYAGKIRFRVAGKEALAKGPRAAGAGETTLLSEDFSGLSGSSVTEYNGWTGTKLFNGTNCFKLGNSSLSGEAISPVVTNADAAGRVEYTLRKYGNDSTSVALTYTTDGGSSWTSLTNHSAMPSSATSYSVDFAASQTAQFKWQGTGKRFHLGPVAVYAAAAVVESNQPPVIDLEPSDTAVELTLGDTYEIDLIATEYDGDTITLDATALPSGATWVAGNPGTGNVEGAFEWTPAATGTYTAVFAAWDKDGTNTQTVVFTVVPEGAGTLAFVSANVNARENSTATLTVLRTGGATGTVTVAWATANGTATAGSDYTAGSGTLTFAAGETSKSLTVAVLDDSSAENNETFTVTLGNATGGAALGSPSICTVTIIDDDDENASYYASCYKNGALKTGDDLKNALCQIINTGVRTNSYGSNLNPMLNVIDACPTNSRQVQCIYLQRGLATNSYNKEHLWPQSHGTSSSPGQGDLHHLRACDSTMNSSRGNLDFDDCQGKSGAQSKNGCYYISNKAWEPPDSAKGDVARAMLYMDVRYENAYNSQYDLELVDSVGTSGNQMGKLSTLLAWNELDPVDAFETNRNELIYTTYQGNRNPFIDHPDWARAVFDPSNYVPVSAVWTVNVTIEGEGWVNYQEAFSTEVTNGLTKPFYIQSATWNHYHIGSITWNGELVPTAYYTNASEYNYTCPAVTNHSTLAVVFAPDLAALGTPIPWLAQYGTNETSVAGEQWDAAELEDWNDDGVPNWQEYVNGTDPTAFSLRQVTNLAATAATSDGFTLGWNAVANAGSYRVRVCSTAAVAAASAGFEGGSVDSGWSTGGAGATVGAAGAMEGAYGLAFATNGAWLCSPAVTNPSSVEFLYKRSTKTNAWTLVVEVSADGGTEWKTVATVVDATDTAQTFSADLTAWRGETVVIRLRDARESGAQARYVDAVTVWSGGATVAEGTATGTSWTVTGLEAGTTYGTMVRAEATSPENAVGPWSVVVLAATATDDSGRSPQTISFPEIADQIATNTVALGATADSGLPVTYTVAGNAVESGGVLTFTGDGEVTVTASQAGNEAYAPAVSVPRTFTVAKAAQEIAWAEIGDQSETATVALSAAATSGGAVAFTVAGGNAAIAGNVLTFTGTGEVTVTATQAGGPLWAAAATSQTFTVSAVVLGAPENIWASATNTTDFSAAWSAVDGATGYELAVWTEGEGTTGTTTNETVVLSGDFTGLSGSSQLNNGFIEGWTVSSAYASNGAVRIGTRSAQGTLTSPGMEVHGTLRVVSTARAWTGDTGPMWVEVDGVAQSNALTTSYAVFTNEFENLDGWYSIVWRTASGTQHRVLMTSVEATEVSVSEETSGVMVPVAGYEARAVAGTSCAVTGLTSATEYHFHARATAGSTTGAWSETAAVTTLSQGGGEGQAQSITFGSIADQVVGATVTLAATASSGLPVTYSVSGPASLEGTTLTCTGVGTVTVTASQAGNGVWAAAADVTQAFEVSKKTQDITFGAIADQTVGATLTLGATASSGLAVTYSVSGPATLAGTTLTCTGVGTVTVTASQAGNGEWAAAADVERSFAVTAAPTELTAPANVWAAATNETTFTAEWSAVAAAAWYELTVWTGGGTQTDTTTNETTLFSTDFADITGNGNTQLTNGFIEGWTVTKAYAGTNEVRVGASSALGWVKSATVGVTGTVKVVTRARAWSGDSTVLWVGVTGCDSQTNTLSDTSAGFTNVFENVEGAVTVCWSNATSSKQRFFLEEVSASKIVVTAGSAAGSEPVPGYEARTVDATTCVVTGLTASTEYGFKVRAVAGQESSAWSSDAAVTTLAAKQPQTITFDPIANQTVGATVTLGATASSGLTVSYTVSGPATLEGNTLTCTGAGTVKVTASQAGNDSYEAAISVERSFEVSLVPQTIDFPTVGNQIATATVPLSATASSGLGVTFALVSGPAVLNGSSLTFAGAGEVTVTATQSGDTMYAPASASQTFTVSKAPQSIDFPSIAGQSVGDTVTLGTTASSGLDVSYTVSGPATLVGNTLTCTGAGMVTVTANQSGNVIYDAATPIERSFEVSLVAQSIAFEPIGDQVATNTVTLSATATSGLDVTFAVTSGPATLNGSTLTFTGAGEVAVTATQAGNGTYASASASQAFTVTKAVQSITFPAIAGQSVGDTVTLNATASSGLAVSYTVGGSATLEGNTLTCTGAGSVTVTASQVGNDLYAAAADVVQEFIVSLVTQSIHFETIGNQVATNIVSLSATADSGLEVAFAVTSGPAALNGSTLTFTGAGEVMVTAIQAGDSTYASATASQTFMVSKAMQSIAFPAIAGQSVDDTVTLNATASSGLAVNYTVSGPATLDGSTLTCTGAGTVTVTASQDGNAMYEAAENAVRTFEVSLLEQTVSFPAVGNQVATNTVTLSATASSGLDVSYAVTSGPAEVNGSTLTFTGAGEVTVAATQAGNGTYASATASQTFTVSKAVQSIDFPSIAGQAVGDTVTLGATASSGLAVTYTVNGPATLAGDTLTCTGAGTVTVTANQDGDDFYEAAMPVGHSFEVSLVEQAINFTAIGDQVATNAVTLTATSSSGLEVTFTVTSGPAEVSGTTLTFTGAGEVTVTASQAGDATYGAATASQMFTVAKAAQSITFDAIGEKSVGDRVVLEATASSGLTASYTVSGPATLEGNTLTCTGAGNVTVTASQSGNAIYDAATPIERSFEVSLVAQSITFDSIGNQVATNTVMLSATATSGFDVTFAVTSGSADVDGTTLTFTAAGEVTVTATQVGNSTYAPATASQTFTVVKAAQSITFDAIAGKSVGDTVVLSATASSGLDVSYTASGPVERDGNTLTCTGAGIVTVTARQDGNALYDGATPVAQSFEVSLVAQSITFETIGNQVATNIVTLSATADSGLEVAFTVTSGSADVDGTTLTFTAAGEVTVTATQVGNSTYAPATASQTFTVVKAAQSITFDAIAGKSVGDTVVLSAMASSGLDVAYTVSGPVEREGNTLTCTGAGTVTVTASQDGNALYDAATPVAQSFEVSLVAQSITFETIGNQVATNTVTLSSTASSGLDVTFEVINGLAMLNGSTLTFTGAGEVTVTATQTGNSTYASASASQTFTVAKATQSITFDAIAGKSVGDTVVLSAMASSGLDVAYTVSGPVEREGNTLTCTGAGTATVTASQEGNALFEAATPVEQSFEVSLVAQSITFETIGNQVATNIVMLSAAADSGLEVTFTVASGPAVVDGGTLTFTGAGEVTVTATQAGNSTYAPASTSQTFTVAKAGAVVALEGLSWTYDGTGKSASVTTVPEGLPVALTYDGGTELPVNAGNHAVVATVVDGIWEGQAEGTMVIAKATQTIAFEAIGEKTTADTVTLGAVASSGLAVSYDVSGPAQLAGTTLTFTGAGTVTVTASQAGNENWEAAEDAVRSFEITVAALTPKEAYEAWLEGKVADPGAPDLAYGTATEDDADGDGVSNWLEYLADTDPTDKEDFLRLAVELRADGTWLAKPDPASTNRNYWLVTRTDLADDATQEEFQLGPGTEGLAATNAMPEGRSIWFGVIRADLPPAE